MRLVNVEKVASPDTPGCARATALFNFDDGTSASLWVDVPANYADALSVSGNPWLVAMLPVALCRGEHIQLTLPVDALLLENIHGVMATWREWYPDLQKVSISCPVAAVGSLGATTATHRAAFFSGGVDSYFTIARRLPGNPYGLPVVGQIDDLITVWGFDVGIHDDGEFLPMAARLGESAEHLGLNHLVVRTNLREFDGVYQRRWGPLTFGLGLAFIGLMMERRIGELIIGSSYPFGALVPWGSHPMVDPLFSTSSLKVSHDGASYTRIGKTALVSQLPVSGADLHVCQASGVDNCSECEKCYRTMVAIDILGQREHFQRAFDWSEYRLEMIQTIYIGSGDGRIFYQEMIEAAKSAGRHDIAQALKYAATRSAVLALFVAGANVLTSIPVLWRLGRKLRQAVLAGSVSARYIEHPGKPLTSA